MADRRLQFTRLGCGTEYIDGYHQDRYQYNGEVQIQFLIPERCLEPSHRDYIIKTEVDAKEQHEDRRDILGKRRICGQSAVENRKTACPGGAKRDADRIEQRHFADEEEQDIQKSQGYVQRIKDHRRVTHARDHLGDGRPRRFGAQQMHHIAVVFPGRRHDGKEEHQHAHAPDPVAERAPVQKALPQRLHVRNHRSTCCREARYDFKERIDIIRDTTGQAKWQRSDQGQCHPCETRADKSLFCVKALLRISGYEPEHETDTKGNQHCDKKRIDDHQIPGLQRNQQSRNHKRRLDCEHPSQDAHHDSVV